MFKTMAWLIKLSMLTYLFSIYSALRKNYFPKLSSLCCKEVRAVISGYSKSWTRGKQLCPVFTYTVDGKEYSEALNKALIRKNKINLASFFSGTTLFL